MLTRTLIFCTLMMTAFPAIAQDPARDMLLSVLNRFGNHSVFSLVDVAKEERFGGNETYQVEVWKKGTAGTQTIAMFVRAPKSERGMGLLIQESAAAEGGHSVRHMYLPAMDRITEVRGLRQSRIEKRLSGLVGPTLLEIGPRTQATTIGIESLENVRCLRIRAENGNGENFEIWLEESASPVVRRAVRLAKGDKVEQVLQVESIQTIGGRRMEGAGTITVPKKSETRFEIVEGRLLSANETGPFTIETFANHARKLAKTKASSE